MCCERLSQGLDPVDVLLVRRDSRNTGEAFVLFGTAMQVGMFRTCDLADRVGPSWLGAGSSLGSLIPLPLRSHRCIRTSQMDFALQKNRHTMGRRYVEVFRAKKQVIIPDSAFCSPDGSHPRGASIDTRIRHCRLCRTTTVPWRHTSLTRLLSSSPTTSTVTSSASPPLGPPGLCGTRARPDAGLLDGVRGLLARECVPRIVQ